MLIKHMYSIYDTAAEVYSDPMYFRSEGEAIRAFTQGVNNPQTQLALTPEHYQLYRVGNFNDCSGEISPEPPTHVVNAIALVESAVAKEAIQ